jgi:plastocyanin
VRFITRAFADGSKAVTPEQFDSVLRGRRPVTITWMGFVGLLFILYLMVFKPTLGLKPGVEAEPGPAPSGVTLQLSANNSRFSASTLTAPAGERFTITFQNKESIPHNVAIYKDSSAAQSLFKGEQFGGPRTKNYAVPALPAGSYFFRCDVHPTEMTGTLKAG